jgi:hypothetical protein
VPALWIIGEVFVIPYLVNKHPRWLLPWTIYSGFSVSAEWVYYPWMAHKGLIPRDEYRRWFYWVNIGSFVVFNLIAGDWWFSPIGMLGLDFKSIVQTQ